MPWTAKEFQKKHWKKGGKRSKKAAKIASAMVRSGAAEGVAIATGIARAKGHKRRVGHKGHETRERVARKNHKRYMA